MQNLSVSSCSKSAVKKACIDLRKLRVSFEEVGVSIRDSVCTPSAASASFSVDFEGFARFPQGSQPTSKRQRPFFLVSVIDRYRDDVRRY